MANFFDSWRATQFGATGETALGVIDFKDDTIDVVLIDTGTVDPAIATHDAYNDISTALIGTSTALTSKSSTISGNVWVFDAADVTISSVTGASAEELVLYKDTGTGSTSPLICQWDSGDVTGLPVTPNGGDITITWNGSGSDSI